MPAIKLFNFTGGGYREKNLKVDEEKFELLMNEQKARDKASWKGRGDKTASGDFKNLLEKFGEKHFVGYEKAECESKI